jgi:hypothetical protein
MNVLNNNNITPINDNNNINMNNNQNLQMNLNQDPNNIANNNNINNNQNPNNENKIDINNIQPNNNNNIINKVEEDKKINDLLNLNKKKQEKLKIEKKENPIQNEFRNIFKGTDLFSNNAYRKRLRHLLLFSIIMDMIILEVLW